MPNPHEHKEDPERHIGEVIPDPWDDPEQKDWPDNPKPEEETDGGTGPAAG